MIAAALGCTVVLPRRFDPERTLALIERHRVEAMAVVPVMLKRIMDLPAETRRALRHRLAARRRVQRLGARAGAGAVVHGRLRPRALQPLRLDGDVLGDDRDARGPARGAGDRRAAVPHTAVVDARRARKPASPTGEIGRIFVGSEMLFDGYTDGSASREHVDGMMTVGDLGHLDDEGRLFVDAREDDMIVSGGENVYPGEVEAVLRGHPGVGEVVGRRAWRTSGFGQRLVGVRRAGAGQRR